MTSRTGASSAHGAPDLPGVAGLVLPRTGLLAEAMRRLSQHHRERSSDFSDITVVLPTLAPAAAAAGHLVQVLDRGVLLPPCFTTFRELAEAMPVEAPRVPDIRRELALYGVLRDQGLVARGALWPSARELRQLADELTLHRVGLADSLDEFSRRVEAAYGVSGNQPMQFEARVAFEAWRQLAGDGDAASRYQLGLSAAAAAADGPLWIVDAGPLRPSEHAFLAAWATRHPVVVIEADLALDTEPFARLLAAAWPRERSEPLADRAATIRASDPVSPAVGRLSFHGALHLEDEAAAADLRVRQWLADGVGRIAIVALDRLAARRLRALLERGGVLVQDETGWTLSTVAAATVAARWLDCFAEGFPWRGLLDLLKSPYLFSDRPPGFRRECVARMEHWIRDGNVVAGLDGIAAKARQADDGAPVLAVIDALTGARAAMDGKRAPAAVWMSRLRAALDRLGVTPGLAADTAGAQLLDCLSRLASEAQGDALPLVFSEWRRWLDGELERALFRDRDIRSPVVMSHPAALRLRRFDAVVLLGADTEHLPQHPAPGLFFNDAVRGELELPTAAMSDARALADLTALMTDSDRCFVTWQARRDGETVPPAPWLDTLEALHEIAWGSGLRDDSLRTAIPVSAVPAPEPAAPPLPATMPAPAAGALLSPRLTVSAWGSLVACPYRFHARHLLRLNDLDDVTEALEKRDFGELVHRVLLRFHDRFRVTLDHPRETLEAALHQITDDVFGRVAAFDYLAHAWAARWRKRIPPYLDFQRGREESGWRWSAGEVSREFSIDLDDGSVVTLSGRLDRVDVHAPTGDRGVLDYKTQPSARLRDRLADDVQLTSYALLEPDASAAGFVAVDEDPVKPVLLAGDVRAAAADEHARLRSVLSRVRADAPLPAHGDDAACTHCEMRGLCRRDHWA